MAEVHTPLADNCVVVATLPGRSAKDPETGKPLKWPHIDGFLRYNVCSSAQGESKQLSPMILGPVVLEEFGLDPLKDLGAQKGVTLPSEATCVENAWQFSKLWEGEEGKDGKPTQEWYQRRRDGFLQKKGRQQGSLREGPRQDLLPSLREARQEDQHVQAS